MNIIEVYYFSGTGNSLHAARELQKRIPTIKLIPIVSLLDKDVIETNAETVGFVFPTYLTTPPSPVKKFIERLNLKSSTYIFSITTRIGIGVANTSIEKALKKKGKALDLSFNLKMANNTPTGLKPIGDKNWVNTISKEKIDKLELKVQKELDSIKECIINKKKNSKRGPLYYLNSFFDNIMSSVTKDMKNEIPFYADSDCNSCGICEKVCLSKKIRLIDKKPVWSKDVQCYYCYACFNYCPNQSVLVGKIYTDKNGRYFHAEINADDIGEQKMSL